MTNEEASEKYNFREKQLESMDYLRYKIRKEKDD